MKIILSPSKLYKLEALYCEHQPVIDDALSEHLRNLMSNMTYNELAVFTGLKSKSADAVYALYNSEADVSLDAFGMYDGIVFKEINSSSYDDNQLDYLRRHGVVLSAMYGVLEADMSVVPYRLDMMKKLNGINLYDYWQKKVDQYFSKVEVIVNLASLEFSKMLKHYSGRMINIHFKEEQSDGVLKVITVRAKQARGQMFDYMVSHCIECLDEIKMFDGAGYRYSKTLSDGDNWYFVKSYGEA